MGGPLLQALPHAIWEGAQRAWLTLACTIRCMGHCAFRVWIHAMRCDQPGICSGHTTAGRACRAGRWLVGFDAWLLVSVMSGAL